MSKPSKRSNRRRKRKRQSSRPAKQPHLPKQKKPASSNFSARARKRGAQKKGASGAITCSTSESTRCRTAQPPKTRLTSIEVGQNGPQAIVVLRQNARQPA